MSRMKTVKRCLELASVGDTYGTMMRAEELRGAGDILRPLLLVVEEMLLELRSGVDDMDDFMEVVVNVELMDRQVDGEDGTWMFNDVDADVDRLNLLFFFLRQGV